MPTPSDTMPLETGTGPRDEWAPRTDAPRRSVFRNYGSGDTPERGTAPPVQNPTPEARPDGPQPDSEPLRSARDTALARAFLYRFLAKAFEDPTAEGWQAMTTSDCVRPFRAAVASLTASAPGLAAPASLLASRLSPEEFVPFHAAYLAAFGHAARGSCPLNEIEYGDLKADPLFQPHRLADLAAFYRAFGLDLAPDAGERQDHLCLELEFMCVLAAKEAYALDHRLDPELLGVCREAQKAFLREHLGRWTPAFTRRIAPWTQGSVLGELARFACAFVEAECARFRFAPGSADLLLRPVNEAEETMCSACGIPQAPPGATAPIETT